MAVAEDRRRITIRLVVLQVCAVVVFAALTISFWFLQVVQNSKFKEMAQNNHQRTLALRAPRGVLFDRNGKVLVENRHAYRISIVREHTKDIERTIGLLASVIAVNPDDVREAVNRYRGQPSYRPVVVVEDASLAQVADYRSASRFRAA
jgi:penicillin-binding protein 2